MTKRSALHRHRRLLLAPLLIVATACADDATSDDVAPGTSAADVTVDAGDQTADSSPPTVPDTAPDDQSDDTVPSDATAPSSTDPAEPGSTTTVNTSPPSRVAPLYEGGDIDQGLQPFIAQATDDLALRLDVEPESISTHAAVIVVWPDSSLGCPQPGMSYAQVGTDGSVIELDHDGAIYRYHTGGQSGPFICEQALDKTPPANDLDLDAGSADT